MTGPGHYRAPMRSRRDDVDPAQGVLRGLALGVCGVGGRLDQPPPDVASALAMTERRYGERRARALRRFIEVPVGSVVWTLDDDGWVHRGTLAGPWRYDGTRAAWEADLVHVRPCAWTPLGTEQVPAAVQATFRRGGRNFQRIRALGGGTGTSPAQE